MANQSHGMNEREGLETWHPIATAPKGPMICVARKGGQRDDGSTYWYQAIGHYDPNLGHFHKSYGELYGEPELWAVYPENPERCSLSSTDRAAMEIEWLRSKLDQAEAGREYYKRQMIVAQLALYDARHWSSALPDDQLVQPQPGGCK